MLNSKLEKSSLERQIDSYLSGNRAPLIKTGTHGLVRELVGRIIEANVWAKAKYYELAVAQETPAHELPHLSPIEKVLLCHMVVQNSHYPKKHSGKIFYRPSGIYVTSWYSKWLSREKGFIYPEAKLTRLNITARDIHNIKVMNLIGIYGSAMQNHAMKMRVLSALYRSDSELTIEEKALLKDKPNQKEGKSHYAGAINKSQVPFLTPAELFKLAVPT